ncbi:PqiC family protein [Desulfobacterales bacterium HSG17]|nr:PqiC family protein [Desulfobacterales bacterium HSG17]
MKYFSIKSFIFITLILILCSCSRTGPSRFYILNSLSDTETDTSAAKNNNIIIGVGPVDIPDYLERPQIVTRTRQNNLVLAEFDKWAGSLKHDIPLVLAENLSVALNTDHVFIYPWKSVMPVKYQVKLEIIRFDAEPEKQATLIARWLILGKDGRKVIKMKKSKISWPIKEKGYEAIVSAQSQALAVLSHDIANSIKND